MKIRKVISKGRFKILAKKFCWDEKIKNRLLKVGLIRKEELWLFFKSFYRQRSPPSLAPSQQPETNCPARGTTATDSLSTGGGWARGYSHLSGKFHLLPFYFHSPEKFIL
ncbi:MAG: hypothetical protein NUW07_09805, partial [Candidatus Saccharicenans sp.]|nr:hypothetical protein [Candidatus Saccharicenans sp.]